MANMFYFVIGIGILSVQILCQNQVDNEGIDSSGQENSSITIITGEGLQALVHEENLENDIPLPFPKNVGNWYVRDNSTGSGCIRLRGAIQLEFYDNLTSKSKSTFQSIDVPVTAKVAPFNGSCTNVSQTLRLTWIDHYNNETLKLMYTLDFDFLATQKNHYNFSKIGLTVKKSNSTNETTLSAEETDHKFSINLEKTFEPIPLNHSFLCISKTTMEGNLTVLTADLQFEAFRPVDLENDKFNVPELCKADITTAGTIAGIIIGSILAVLIGIGFGVYMGVRFGYCRFPCCRSGEGYQPLIH